MEILQVVGYKGSRKTSITKEIIHYLTGKGLKVGALKHHGHGGIPLGLENTDSEQHRIAGASISGVMGEHILQLSSNTSWNMEEVLAIYKLIHIDILMIEGFKQLNYPKLVLLRNNADLELLNTVTNVLAVIKPKQMEFNYIGVTFNIEEIEKICHWTYRYFYKLRSGN